MSSFILELTHNFLILFLQINSIENRLKQKFSLYTNEEKIIIKTLGRPVPDLNLIKVIKQQRLYI